MRKHILFLFLGFALCFGMFAPASACEDNPSTIRVAFNIEYEAYAVDAYSEEVVITKNRYKQTTYQYSYKYRTNVRFDKEKGLLQLEKIDGGQYKVAFRTYGAKGITKMLLVGTATPVDSCGGRVIVSWQMTGHNAEKLGMVKELEFMAANPEALRETYPGLRMYTTAAAQSRMDTAGIHIYYHTQRQSMVVVGGSQVLQSFKSKGDNVMFIDFRSDNLLELTFNEPAQFEGEPESIIFMLNLKTGRVLPRK